MQKHKIYPVLLSALTVLMSSFTDARAQFSKLPFVEVQPGVKAAPAAEDLRQLAATHNSKAWLLCIWQIGMILESDDEVGRFSGFFPPVAMSSRLRRGYLERGYLSRDPHSHTVGWHADEGRAFKEYAQVSPADHPFGSTLEKPAWLDIPFVMVGKLKDKDLVTIVDLVRQRQQAEAAGKILEGSNDMMPTFQPAQPVQLVERKSDGSVEVNTVQDRAIWRVYRVTRKHGRWTITETSEAVA